MSTQIEDTVNHLFRVESGKMVSVLVNIFGTENYEMAEDVVSGALLVALENWKIKGIPENPKAWLYRVAKNKAIDVLRREKFKENIDFNDPERVLLKSEYTLTTQLDSNWEEKAINDEFLAMMFACCHPSISEDNQKTFILKSLCGFSTKEISKAFLSEEQTISKRLYRTKEFFRKNKIKPEIPDQQSITERIKVVLSTIYLIFNEGYNSTHSDELIRSDLIKQAFHLSKCLTDNKKTSLPEVYALLALMCFHSSRVGSRTGSTGNLITLEKQNRSLWNQELILQGKDYLNKSAFGDAITSYHLEASIAYEHCIAKDYKSTNWQTILVYYNQLLFLTNDPIVALNKVVVILELEGANKAYEYLEDLESEKIFKKYYLFYSIKAEILEKMNKKMEARKAFESAKKLRV